MGRCRWLDQMSPIPEIPRRRSALFSKIHVSQGSVAMTNGDCQRDVPSKRKRGNEKKGTMQE